MLQVSVRFLGGEFVAQTHDSASEWPPHPARLLYALIAAWHDGGCRSAEEDTLSWLESLESPSIVAPEDAPREEYEAWLPMNSIPNWNKKGAKAPSMPKTRRLRSSRYLGDESVDFVWAVDPPSRHLGPLLDLCRRCTRLGSAESLVMLSVSQRAELHGAAWRPSGSGTLLRAPTSGTIRSLAGSGMPMPGRQLPCDWQAYRWSLDRRPGRMITVGLTGGDWPVEHAPVLAVQLRRAFIALAEAEQIPLSPILHGHEQDGSPLRKDHLQFCPLPHVGFRHAIGAVLGAAFILPQDATEADRAYAERLVATWFAHGAELRMPGGWLLSFGPADSRRSLAERRWCQPATVWQTVVPMELPRHVSGHRQWNRDDWRRVEIEIMRAFSHVGLPQPVEVEASNTAFAVGSPNPRIIRGPHTRPVVHTRVRFPHEIEGPLVVGAGRHLGYGLMEPVRSLS